MEERPNNIKRTIDELKCREVESGDTICVFWDIYDVACALDSLIEEGVFSESVYLTLANKRSILDEVIKNYSEIEGVNFDVIKLFTEDYIRNNK